MEEVTHEDEAWIHLRLTDRTCGALDRMNLFIDEHQRHPINPQRIIAVPKNALIEEYASFLGSYLWTRGAFSYCETPDCQITTGRYCSVAGFVRAFGERHPIERVTSSSITYCFRDNWNKPQFLRARQRLFGAPRQSDEPPSGALPALEHDVWVGQGVHLARDITIGTGAVVGAGAVVTKSVAPYTIVGGNPAKVIKPRFPPELCARLLATEWWNYHPDILWQFGYRDPRAFCDAFEAERGALQPFQYRRYSWKDLLEEIRRA